MGGYEPSYQVFGSAHEPWLSLYSHAAAHQTARAVRNSCSALAYLYGHSSQST